MKQRKSLKVISLILVLGVVILQMAGCSSKTGAGSNASSSPAASDTNVSGSIIVLGSTALQPLADQAAKQFTQNNANASIQVQGGGSGNGLTSVANGTAQIGDSDIFAEEKSGIDAGSLQDHKVCVVGFAAVVNPDVKIDNLTKQQLIDVFTGKVTNWKDVGGNDMPVVIVNRPSSSGTRATFKKYALDGQEEVTGKALTQDSSGTVLQTVASTKGSISYLALSYINDNSIKALKLDGVAPTVDNITSGKYPIWSYEHMYTKGTAAGLAKAFIDYMMSADVKPLVQKLGYIPISDMKVSR